MTRLSIICRIQLTSKLTGVCVLVSWSPVWCCVHDPVKHVDRMWAASGGIQAGIVSESTKAGQDGWYVGNNGGIASNKEPVLAVLYLSVRSVWLGQEHPTCQQASSTFPNPLFIHVSCTPSLWLQSWNTHVHAPHLLPMSGQQSRVCACVTRQTCIILSKSILKLLPPAFHESCAR